MDYLYALQCIREAAPGFVNYIFLFISEFFFMSGIVIASYIYWCSDKSAGCAILMGYSATCFVNQTVKNIACVYRPWVLDSRLHVDSVAAGSATGYSFPSGHTSSAAAVFGGVGIWKRKKIGIVILTNICILLVAFSRNWLGAHTIQDVLVGMIVAAVVLSICAVVRYWLIRHPEKDSVICFGGIAVVVIVLVILCLKSYPLDYNEAGLLLVDPKDMLTDCFTTSGVMIGSLLGMWLERHFVKFEVSKIRKLNIITFIIGILFVGIVYIGFSFIFAFAGEYACHFIKYFTIFMLIFYIYPLVFSHVRGR